MGYTALHAICQWRRRYLRCWILFLWLRYRRVAFTDGGTVDVSFLSCLRSWEYFVSLVTLSQYLQNSRGSLLRQRHTQPSHVGGREYKLREQSGDGKRQHIDAVLAIIHTVLPRNLRPMRLSRRAKPFNSANWIRHHVILRICWGYAV